MFDSEPILISEEQELDYTILAMLFWIHCDLYRLNLERLMKNELKKFN